MRYVVMGSGPATDSRFSEVGSFEAINNDAAKIEFEEKFCRTTKYGDGYLALYHREEGQNFVLITTNN